MKWAVNMRRKTLTVCLSSGETFHLWQAVREVVALLGDKAPSILGGALRKLLRQAVESMFSLAHLEWEGNGNGPAWMVEKVAWDEVSDGD